MKINETSYYDTNFISRKVIKKQTVVKKPSKNNLILKVPGVGRDNLNVEYTTVERGCKYEKNINGVKTVFPSVFSLP